MILSENSRMKLYTSLNAFQVLADVEQLHMHICIISDCLKLVAFFDCLKQWHIYLCRHYKFLKIYQVLCVHST